MRLRRDAVRIGLIAIALAGTAAIAAQDPQQRITPAEVRWPAGASTGTALVGSSGVSGTQTVTLKGDPSQPGLYTILLRVGPNTRIQAHRHPDDRVATVVSGDWYFGYGREFSEAALKLLPPGSFYTEPPGMDHFAMTKATGVVIQISGTGPSGTTYVDPRNDPNRK
jgi:quercetin dioxygenase-like cupin family protein